MGSVETDKARFANDFSHLVIYLVLLAPLPPGPPRLITAPRYFILSLSIPHLDISPRDVLVYTQNIYTSSHPTDSTLPFIPGLQLKNIFDKKLQFQILETARPYILPT